MDFSDLLTKDTSYALAMMLDSETLLNLCQSNKRFYNWIGRDENFWKQKMSKDYPFLLEFKEREQSFHQFYLEMLYYIAKIEKKYGVPYISTKDYNPKDFFKHNYTNNFALRIFMNIAVKGGHMEMVNFMIEKGDTNLNLYEAMSFAGGECQMDILKLLIKKGGKNFNGAMQSAARGGHIDIVKLMLEKGVERYNEAISNAAYGGHIDIVKLMIEKGGRSYDSGIKRAQFAGHVNIVEYLKSLL